MMSSAPALTVREAMHQSKTVEHYTPPEIITAARQVMGSIELDPASCVQANRTVQATRFYTAAENGLTQPWVAATLWCNPPYGRDKTRNHQAFIGRLLAAYEDGDIGQAMLLVNAATGQRWFRPLWHRWICFPYERVDFLDTELIPQKNPTNSNVVVYFGPNGHRFDDIFSALGRVIPPDHRVQHVLQPRLWNGGRA